MINKVKLRSSIEKISTDKITFRNGYFISIIDNKNHGLSLLNQYKASYCKLINVDKMVIKPLVNFNGFMIDDGKAFIRIKIVSINNGTLITCNLHNTDGDIIKTFNDIPLV